MVAMCLQHKYIGGILPVGPAGKEVSKGEENMFFFQDDG
jgi:hypothetical protein